MGRLLRPDVLVRLEGIAAFVLAVWAYASYGGSWVLFGVLFLVPDTSMLGYLAGSKVGAATYNLSIRTSSPELRPEWVSSRTTISSCRARSS